MTIINGHFDGKQVVLDEPVPAFVLPDTPVRVVFEKSDTKSVFEEIARLALSTDDLPADFSEQHDHYVKGTPRK